MQSKTFTPGTQLDQHFTSAHHLPTNEQQHANDHKITHKTESTSFMTTAAAAKMLGLSMATVQKLVDSNNLQAWKTYGGHRRISLASVLNYQSSNNFTKFSRSSSDVSMRMMLVLETENTLKPSSQERVKWNLPMMASYFDSLIEAMLELASEKYDLLVMQLNSNRNQQEKTLEVLQKLMRSRHTVGHALILTTEPDLLKTAEPDSSPVSIQILNQVLSPEWLSAYMSGFGGQQRN
jgi:excisionase family DNA binding protein